jgi:hypothetical protein
MLFPQNLPLMRYSVKKSLRLPIEADEKKLEAALPTTPAHAKPKQMAAIRRAAASNFCLCPERDPVCALPPG